MYHNPRRRPPLRSERRAAAFGPIPINDSHTLFGNYPLTSTGIRVDNYSALCNAAFRRCCEIIAEGLAKLSPAWRLLDPNKKPVVDSLYVPMLTEVSNHYTSAFNFWNMLWNWAESWGNGYAWILRRNNMEPVGLFPLHPSRVMPRLVKGDTPEKPWDVIYQVDGGRATFLPYEILHFKGNSGFDGVTGYNPVMLHENTLAIAQAQEEFTGEFYKNGAVAGGLVELPSHLKPDVVLKYQTDFQNKYSSRGNRHMLALVDSGVKFTKTTIDPEVAQLLEARKFSIFEVCLLKGVPPTMLGIMDNGTFNNTEQMQINFNTIKIHPQAENSRQELNMKLVPPGHKWAYSLEVLDAADSESRQAYIHNAVGGPVMTVQEGREKLGLPREPEGTIYPPPNMNAAPGAGGKPQGGGNGKQDSEGQDGTPTKEDIQEGETEPTVMQPGKGPAGSVNRPEGRSLPETRESSPTGAIIGVDDPQPTWAGAPPGDALPNPGGLVDCRAKAAETLKPIFVDAAQRMADKEARTITGYTKHVREGDIKRFEERAAEFYGRHAGYLKDAFTPALRALQSQVHAGIKEREFRDLPDVDDAAELYATKLGDRHVQAAKESLTAIMTNQQEPNAVADAIDAQYTDLAKARVGAVDRELRMATNHFAAKCYRAAGATKLQWVASPTDMAECLDLDGQTVGPDETFQTIPPVHHPPFPGRECRCGIVGHK